MTNKTLNNCSGNTQLVSDNSTKLATTAFVKLFPQYRRWYSIGPDTMTFGDSPTYTIVIDNSNSTNNISIKNNT